MCGSDSLSLSLDLVGSHCSRGKWQEERKIDSECRNFQEKWTNSYFFVQRDEKLLCLICKEKRHYETKHKIKYDGYVGLCREQKIGKLHEEVGGLTKLFNKRRKDHEAAVRASFQVAHILSKEAKPFSEGECVKKCILAVVEELCLEKKECN
ncbi:hypothetical protein ACJMK2_006720 [Sinanodonta woodiana]|uniref:Uncharacterized protein n=1 Tax=Sinanodonta woodiana TaxID=1069815 RepID=A0ABD3VU20_SINWO